MDFITQDYGISVPAHQDQDASPHALAIRQAQTSEAAKSVRVHGRIGELSGTVVGDVLYFDYDSKEYNKTQRC